MDTHPTVTKPSKTRLTAGKVSTRTHEGHASQSFLWDTEVLGFALRFTKPSKRNPNGGKTYVFQGRFNGQTPRITIGDANVWTLEDARAKARSFQIEIDNGNDPREVKAQSIASDVAIKKARAHAKKEQELEGDLTLRALCKTYCDGLHAKGKRKSATDSLSAFNCHVFTTAFADLPAKKITSKDISQIIRKVFESGKKRTAGILRNYLSATYNAAIKAPYDAQAPSAFLPFGITVNPVIVIPSIPVNKGERHLSVAELRAYLLALTDSPVDLLLKVHLYSGTQRIAQLARIKESDYKPAIGSIELLDAKGKRVKPREHLVPLAPKGMAIIESMRKGRNKFFYSNAREAGKRVSEISKTMGLESFDIGDLRRTCETMLAEMGVSKTLRGRLLSHGIHGVQDEHYDKYQYLKEKFNTLTAWESKLDEIIAKEPNDRNADDIQKVEIASGKVIIKATLDDSFELASINLLPKLLKNNKDEWDYENNEDGAEASLISMVGNYEIQSFDVRIRELDDIKHQSYFVKMRMDLTELAKDLLLTNESQEIKDLKTRLLKSEVGAARQALHGLTEYNYLTPLAEKAKVHIKLSESGKKGAEVRHAKNNKVKDFALAEFGKKKYKSARDGALDIEYEVLKYASSIDSPLSNDGAHRTIYGWIRGLKKVHSSP